jgi:hypothetical protein
MSAAGGVAVGRPRHPLSRTPRALGLLVVFVLLVAMSVLAWARATPAYASACSGKHGVTVVVDFTKLHDGIKVGCDPGHPSTGLKALSGAGFTYTFVPRFPGFVCTIDHKPKKCNGAPASAYWSYWHAKPHGKWTYSSLGAGSYHPKQGWVEGWAFGDGKPPRMSPP